MMHFDLARHRGPYENLSSEDIELQVRALDGRQFTAALHSSTAHYDPVFTPLFTALGFGSFSIAGISGVTIASAIATTALSIGLQYLLAPKPPKPEDGKQPVVQAIPYRQWVVGRRRVSGALMLWEAKGAKLYSVQAIAGHRISAINRYWLHDDEVTLDGSGNVIPLADDRYFGNLVQVYSRLGLTPETAYAPIVSDLAADDVYTANHRGDGQASLAIVATTPKQKYFASWFPYGAPRGSVEVNGAYVWDYRIDDDPSNPAAWVFSRNAALIMCWHQCFSEFGHRRDYQRAILPLLDMWKEEADVCNEDVPLAGGGTEKRYLCDGFATAEHDPKVGTNAILASCDGWLCERGDGALLFVVGKFREKYCGVLKDRDVTGYQLQHDVLFKDECNRLIPKFTYPATDYTTSDTDFFEDSAAQIVAGRVLAQEADYGWCTQWRQARRLGIRDWRRFQEKKKGTLDVRLSGINAIYNRWNRLETPLGLPTLDGAIVENRRSVLALTKGGFTMDFIKHPANIDAWNSAVDEGAAPPVPPKPSIAGIPTPTINSVAAKAKSGVVYLEIAIDDPEQADLSVSIRYRIKDTGGGSPGEWVEQVYTDADAVGGAITVNTNPVPSDQLLEVEAAFLSAKGKYGLWSATSEIFATADPVAPSALASFTKTSAAPHLGNVAFGIATGNDSHIRSVKLYRKASGVPLNVATDAPIATLNVSALGTYAYTDGDASVVNALANPGFDTDTVWGKGTGWTIAGGKANKASGAGDSIGQPATLVAGTTYRYGLTISAVTGGIILARFTGGTVVSGPNLTANGSYRGQLVAASGNNAMVFATNSSFGGSLDDVSLYQPTLSSSPQGVWDYYAVPFNGSGVAGPSTGPVSVTVI